jgi:hypothetical protein
MPTLRQKCEIRREGCTMAFVADNAARKTFDPVRGLELVGDGEGPMEAGAFG